MAYFLVYYFQTFVHRKEDQTVLPKKRAASSPTRILIVEDDPPIAEMLIDLLEMENYRVIWVDTARAGLQILSGFNTLSPRYISAEGSTNGLDHAPDLVLLDLQLPEMDGIELIAQLHGDGVSVPPMIIISAQSDQVLAAAQQAFPHVQMVRKPFPVELLLDVINRALAA